MGDDAKNSQFSRFTLDPGLIAFLPLNADSAKFHVHAHSIVMLSEETKLEIRSIWDNYVSANKPVVDTRGRVINDINGLRIIAISDIKAMVDGFFNGDTSIYEFKTTLDGYNKRNNLWGFTATKGQMFFNQLVKNCESNISELVDLLKHSIDEPVDIDDALAKLTRFELYVQDLARGAKDKRKVPNPGSTGYFLSYFWQIHNHQKFPVFYTSLVKSFTELGIWNDSPTQRDNYQNFIYLNDLIRAELKLYTQLEIDNWDVEHAFWHFAPFGTPLLKKAPPVVPEVAPQTEAVTYNAETRSMPNFDVNEYLIPKVASLVQLGAATEKTKASQYEKLVGEIFRQLDFEVEQMGQGTGRNPDAILRFREEHTAFIVDAKAYADGYGMGTADERAIREYINYYCPKLIKEGFRRIGFIIVSNSFRSSLDEFANDITWGTDVKRFILLTSEALLYLLAYKTKDRDKLNLSTIIESMISSGNLINAQDVIQKFDDI